MKHNKYITESVKQTVRMNKWLSAMLAVFIAGSIFIGILPPLALEKIVNQLAGGENFSFTLVIVYFLLLSVAGFTDAGRESLITRFGQKVTHHIRGQMCHKLKELPADYFTEQDTGITVSRFVNDVDTVESLFTSGVISMVADAFRIISILVIIFIKSMGLGILLVLTLPLLYLFTRVVQKKMLEAQLDNRSAVGRANSHVPDTIRSIRMIHNLHREEFMEARYDRCIEDSFEAVNRANFYDAVYSPVIIVVSAVLVAVMMILCAKGGWYMQLFGMSVGTAVAIISYVSKIFEPLESIGMEIQNIQAAAAGIKRINEFLSEPGMNKAAYDKQHMACEESVEEVISLNNVSFGYERMHEILHGFNLSVKSGERVTLIGRTGAGKSTVFKLVLGLYEAWSGTVEVNGKPAGSICDDDRRRVFGYVEQTFNPIPGTISEQITLGDESISNEQVEKALDTVGLLETVKEFPQGADTQYRTELFSQGQIQLLSIARAIAANPQILLLDEITANLDADTEQRVLAALQAASDNRTVLSISHRLYECSGGRSVEVADCR